MNELEMNYLAHHGVLGQKWGKRNGPPYPLDAGDHSKSEKEAGYKKSLGGGRNEEMYDRKARKRGAKEATKDLNRNDQEMAENRYKFEQAKKKYDKYEKKMSKAKEGSKKREKYAGKALDAYLDSEEAREAVDKGQARTREILGYLEENGYNVKMKDTMRSVNRGENVVKSMLVSGLVTGAATALLGPAGMAGAAVGVTTDRVKGTKFKVKDKTDKERAKERKEASEAAYKAERESVKKTVDQDRGTIAKQASKEMAKDIMRWQKEGSDTHKSFNGKSESDIAKIIEKKINSKIMGDSDSAAAKFGDGKVSFIIDGIEEYGGGQPLDVEYDPKTKKITGMWWA